MTGSSRIVASVIVIALATGTVAAFAVAWRPAIAAIDPPAPQTFDPALVKRGRDLAAIGNCNDCHTARGGKNFAGGLPVPTPFGTIFSSNITPDPETGIGRWSEAAFRRAMRAGVDREGRHLYPTFPYDHFTHVTDEDDRAIYAFLMTRQPVHAPARANQLSFPFDQRPSIAGWKLLFLRSDSYQPDSQQERGVESRRLSGRRSGALRRLPYAAQRAGRRTRQRAVRRRRRRQLARLCDQRPIAVAGAMGRRCACTPICAMAGIPITAPRAARWRRWSAICRRCRTAMFAPSPSIWPACPAPPTPDRKRRGEAALAQAKSPPAQAVAARPPARRSMPRLARPAMRPAGRCPMAAINLGLSTAISASRSAQPRQHRAVGRSCRGGRSAARSCRALPPA